MAGLASRVPNRRRPYSLLGKIQPERMKTEVRESTCRVFVSFCETFFGLLRPSLRGLGSRISGFSGRRPTASNSTPLKLHHMTIRQVRLGLLLLAALHVFPSLSLQRHRFPSQRRGRTVSFSAKQLSVCMQHCGMSSLRRVKCLGQKADWIDSAVQVTIQALLVHSARDPGPET